MLKPIYLWGYMGAGKTRLGKRLAQKLNLEFYDLDRVIENHMQLVVVEIFNQFGEIYFRQLEQRFLEELSQKNNVVISCGGGTPCYHQNKSLMKNSGLVVYLMVAHDELLSRLWRNRTQRPIIADMPSQQALSDFIETHLSQRMPYYSQAHFAYDNTNPKSRLDELVNFITEFRH